MGAAGALPQEGRAVLHHQGEGPPRPARPQEDLGGLRGDWRQREDQSEFEKLCENFKASFNDNAEHRRRWGGGIMGMKSQHKTAKIQKAKDAEEAKKMGMMA